jgi:hypothetical protein
VEICGLTPVTHYTFSVADLDGAGNESAHSNSIAVVTTAA